MHVETLLDAARATTGLDDFGDPGFRDGLDVLVEACNSEAQLNDIGRAAAEHSIVADLSNRLRVTNYWNHHPELADETFDAPLFIVGIVRSGTTALSHLLARIPGNRQLLGWEASQSVPPPTADTYWQDPRYLAAVEADADNMLYALNPEFKAIHHEMPDLPTECVTLMAQDFVSLRWQATFNIASYTDWLLDRDHVPTYRYHQRVLALLQSAHPGRWQLKTPHHALAIEAIAEVYPTARFIWPHRDPVTCVGSASSLARSLTGTFSDGDWAMYEGQEWTRILAAMTDRAMAARDRLGDDRFVDVSYTDLVADPVGTVVKLHHDLGEELSEDTVASLTAHASEHRQNRHGRHTYDFADFGLDRDELAERFSTYRSRFDLA